jgi:ferredoxin
MAVWFLRGVRRGVVTSRYPSVTEAWAQMLPSPPAFRPDLLTSALVDRLVERCPTPALRRDGADLVVDVGACTSCGMCVDIGAPAVAPSGVWELAARDRGALVKRIPIERGPR